MTTSAIQICTTTPTREAASAIARALVERRLAACVQISGPIQSVYRWQEKIETSEEWLCTAKTLASHFPHVEQLVRQLHSYETPEVIATPIVHGSDAYLAWLAAEVCSLEGLSNSANRSADCDVDDRKRGNSL